MGVLAFDEAAGTGVGILNSALNGLAFSALAAAMSDQQLFEAMDNVGMR